MNEQHKQTVAYLPLSAYFNEICVIVEHVDDLHLCAAYGQSSNEVNRIAPPSTSMVVSTLNGQVVAPIHCSYGVAISFASKLPSGPVGGICKYSPLGQ